MVYKGTCSDIFGGNGFLCKPFDLTQHGIDKITDLGHNTIDSTSDIFNNILKILSNPFSLVILIVIAFFLLPKIL